MSAEEMFNRCARTADIMGALRSYLLPGQLVGLRDYILAECEDVMAGFPGMLLASIEVEAARRYFAAAEVEGFQI